MNSTRNRKYARTLNKSNSQTLANDDTELSLSATAALSILGGAFVLGLISGKLIGMCKK